MEPNMVLVFLQIGEFGPKEDQASVCFRLWNLYLGRTRMLNLFSYSHLGVLGGSEKDHYLRKGRGDSQTTRAWPTCGRIAAGRRPHCLSTAHLDTVNPLTAPPSWTFTSTHGQTSTVTMLRGAATEARFPCGCASSAGCP